MEIKIKEENLIYTYKGWGVRCPNQYYMIDDNTIAIRVTNTSGEIVYGIIDIEDFEKVKVCNWKIRKDCLTYYLCNSKKGMIHRLIMNPDDNMQVDHIDGNGLNNKKSNLRIVTGMQNSRNHHNVTGISFDDTKGYPRFRVIWVDDNGKQCSKSFSLSKYSSLDVAYQKAKEYRIWIETNIYRNHRYFENINK